MHAPKGSGEGTMTVMSERDVLAEGLRELAKELDAIKALIPEDLEEVSLRLEKARASIGLTLEEANAHRSHPEVVRGYRLGG
jgi:hypothetical protein